MARYLSSAQGRFTTPDWSPTPQPIPFADLADPQTLNLCCYVRNNPLDRTDPDGHDVLAEALFAISHPEAAVAIGTYSHGSTNITTNAIRLSTSPGLSDGLRTERGADLGVGPAGATRRWACAAARHARHEPDPGTEHALTSSLGWCCACERLNATRRRNRESDAGLGRRRRSA